MVTRYRKLFGLVSILTLATAVAASCAWLMLRHRNSNETGEIKVIALCELLANPNKYVSQEVKVEGIVLGFHQLALYDPGCNSTAHFLPADFTPTARQELIASVDALQGSAFQRGNFWVRAASLGRLQTFDTDNQVKTAEGRSVLRGYRLVVSHVENANHVPPDIRWPE